MKYVIGIDLGTSAVKLLLVNQDGEVEAEVAKTYPVIQHHAGYSEQDPDSWVDQTVAGISELLSKFQGNPAAVEGVSFSGQMHGLVLLSEAGNPVRHAILWNDTRTSLECKEIEKAIGKERLLQITKNRALEGFTLPKIRWVQKNEPEVFRKAVMFVLPKDYVRYKLTGYLHTDYSDAAGTLLLDVGSRKWSKEICNRFDLPESFCPPLAGSDYEVGTITPEISHETGLTETTRVFVGGADNACGAIGSGILEAGKTLASIGTSGVVLSHEACADKDFGGKVHYFNHAEPNAFYSMGVTLAAGDSLSWFKQAFAKEISFDQLIDEAATAPVGSGGLLFTPYIAGERTPHVNANIRGSFIGMNISHQRKHFVRSVLEGITFSLNESLQIFRENQKPIDTVISIGGGAKSNLWLQMQADIFQAEVVKLSSEQGPAMGAAMLAAFGCGWFSSLKDCAAAYVKPEKKYTPNDDSVTAYQSLFGLYQEVYAATNPLNEKLKNYRS